MEKKQGTSRKIEADSLAPEEELAESNKRRKEILWSLLLGLAFLLLTWFEIELYSTAQQLPFVHSVFFLAYQSP